MYRDINIIITLPKILKYFLEEWWGKLAYLIDIKSLDRKSQKVHMFTEIFEVTDPYVNYTEKTTLWVKVVFSV